jgi:hypothetical protein
MQSRLGISRTAYKWSKPYLPGRSQTVGVGEVFTVVATGFRIRPIVFLIETLLIGDIARKHDLIVHLYAD